MLNRIAILLLSVGIFLAGASVSYAQSSEDDDNTPKSFKETLVKLRIDQEKKDFDEMLGRGVEALKLSEELEKAYSQNGRLNPQEINKLNTVEKLVKKIRSDLGGDDDESEAERDEQGNFLKQPLSQGDAVKTFRSTTLRLLEELKKTSRFTVSAAAIQASNAVLKLARMLRISR